MRFQLNGEFYEIDPDVARARILSSIPDPVRTHWVEIDGRRWPAKQAFEVATGVPRGTYISHTAVRLLARLGLTTSEIPHGTSPSTPHPPRQAPGRPPISAAQAAEAFSVLDAFLQQQPLTAAVARLEAALAGADADAAGQVADETGFNRELIDAALIVRERVGVLDSLIHAAVITQTIPLLLQEGEHVLKRPSLAAGNDSERIYDLETTLRVAEFKVAQWKGADSLRQRGLVADLVGLAMDPTGRQRQLFVVGPRPRHFLQTSGRTVANLLSKSALRLRHPGAFDLDSTIADFTRMSGVEIIDLAQWFPSLDRPSTTLPVQQIPE